MKKFIMVAAASLVVGCGNPGGISDAEYANYNEMGAPKILYVCAEPLPYLKKVSLSCPNISAMPEKEMLACVEKATKRYSDPNEKFPNVSTISGVGMNATYNYILEQAKRGCSGDFKVLESKQ